jgi:acetyl esterase/lipase
MAAHVLQADPAADGQGDRLVVAGWSMGGRAAAALGLDPAAARRWRPVAVVCLAAGFSGPGVVTPAAPLAMAGSAREAPPFYLVHGSADTVVSINEPRRFAAVLTSAGHRVSLHECPSDHAGVVMTEYDPSAGQCRPATAGHALHAGYLAARTLREAAEVHPGAEHA